MVGWWGMDIGRPTREAFAGTVMWDDDCLDQDIGGENDKKVMELSYLLKTESTGVDKNWMRGPCPCKQDPIKSRDEEDSPWNQTSTYLSPGSAMHLPGHLGALPAQCLWCLRTLGLYFQSSWVCTHYPVAGILTVPWYYVAQIQGVEGSPGDYKLCCRRGETMWALATRNLRQKAGILFIKGRVNPRAHLWLRK